MVDWLLGGELPTNRKWVTTLVTNGISGVSPLRTGVITHLLSGMNHQVRTKEFYRLGYEVSHGGSLPSTRLRHVKAKSTNILPPS